jgi:hypothetical protein
MIKTYSTAHCRGQLKCDGTRPETRFRLSAKRTSPFKSAGASVQSTTGSRGVRISGSNVGYTMFRGSVKSTGYPLHSPVSPLLPLPCVTGCHHVSAGVLSCSGQRLLFSLIPASMHLSHWLEGVYLVFYWRDDTLQAKFRLSPRVMSVAVASI